MRKQCDANLLFLLCHQVLVTVWVLSLPIDFHYIDTVRHFSKYCILCFTEERMSYRL